MLKFYTLPVPVNVILSDKGFLQMCAVVCLVVQACPTLCDPTDCSPPGSSVHGDSSGKNTGVGCQCPSPGDLTKPRIELKSPESQAESLLTEPPGKPLITVVLYKWCML